ncbi:hypothetical protein [Falsiroseomonas bella]|uniref:hypothetical protein n=1 Tax=Falsiroseomonas bella TaxID=2184016 RepID=UPI001E5F7A43|nr:hypothetical protein [Falsiroseomonas bella]
MVLNRAGAWAAGLVLLLGACAAPPEPVPPVPLQPQASAADPARQAVLSAAAAFADPARLAGHPADAARAVAQLAWMSVALQQDQWWTGANPTLFFTLREAEREVRGALGVRPEATTAAVTMAFAAAASALERDRRDEAAAALAPVAAAGGEAVLTRLDPMPLMPRAAAATHFADQQMLEIMRSDPE